MLYEITESATALNALIVLNARDNVAIARRPLDAGVALDVNGVLVQTRTSIPTGHKVATRTIQQGQPVYRYGNLIGFATQTIAEGEHIHVHNLGYREADTEEIEPDVAAPASYQSTAFFEGFQRTDGRVGTRNYIAIVAASNCAAHVAELIAQSFAGTTFPANVDGVVAFPHGEGCAMVIGPDTEQLQRTLEGVLDHPNISAALILGLGCEVNQIGHYLGNSDRSPNSIPATLQGLTIQDSGGTLKTVESARRQVLQFIERAAEEKRTQVPASKIMLGLNCGGSDSFSGISANPALGFASDQIVAQGGAVVLAETTEIFGAEHLLLRRARSREVGRKLIHYVNAYKSYLRQFGGSFNDNPSPGNKEGGLTNILEKSLGAIAKAGTTPLEDVVDYAERVKRQWLCLHEYAGATIRCRSPALAAGGVNLIAFTTGRGSAIGFPSIPVLKISSNSNTYRRMRDNMDINAGRDRRRNGRYRSGGNGDL